MSKVRFLGLDVHAETISAAIAEPNGEVRSLGVIRNTPPEVRKLINAAGAGFDVACVLRSGPYRVRAVLAAHGNEGELPSDRAFADSGESE